MTTAKIILNSPGAAGFKGDLDDAQVKNLFCRLTEEDRALFVSWFKDYHQVKGGTYISDVNNRFSDEEKERIHRRVVEAKERLNVSNNVLNTLMASVYYEYCQKTKSATAAQARYDAKATKRISLKLNLKTDADILAKLEAEGNTQGYIKELIREDLRRAK